MSPIQKGQLGINPLILRISDPNLKDGVIVGIVVDTSKYLPRPSGRGLSVIPTIEGF